VKLPFKLYVLDAEDLVVEVDDIATWGRFMEARRHIGWTQITSGPPVLFETMIFGGPLDEHQWRFVIAHEMLHAALRHGDRVGGRDPYLWNCAADFVINGWLVEMRVGEAPDGLLHDPALAGLSAEAVYDLIATDLRRLRKLATLRGQGLGDVLGHPLRGPDARGGVDLDEYYRRALCTGLAYHENGGRGLVPAGLVEEIRALDQPPLPWDAQLARWFEEFVPAAEPRRSYSRPSRRQASTPDIPRPGWRRPNAGPPPPSPGRPVGCGSPGAIGAPGRRC